MLLTHFTIPCIPPSYNANFNINYNLRQVYLTKEAREFKRMVKLMTPNVKIDDNALLKITIKITNNWYYKNTNIKKLDIQNLDKLLVDALFEKLQIDDSHIFELHLIKLQDTTKEHTDIILETI